MLLKLLIFISLFLITNNAFAQKKPVPNFDQIEYDTSSVNVFEGTESINFKLDYYHTDGYSHKDRYWYEIIILDSLLILNFQSPNNLDWNFINYQKQLVIEDSVKEHIINLVLKSKLNQKIPGIPRPPASAYGGNRLFINYGKLNIAGGDVYLSVGEGDPEKDKTQENVEREYSSSIGGNYDPLLAELEKLFPLLKSLLKDMENYETE